MVRALKRRIESGVQAAHEAVEGLRPVGHEEDPSRADLDAWQVLCRQCLRGWIEAMARDLDIAVSCLRSAASTAGFATRARRCEEALWRIASAREKLLSILALSLNTPVLEPSDKAKVGIRFRVDAKALIAKIESLAGVSPAALTLLAALEALRDSRAKDLRDGLAHKLSSAGGMEPLVILEERHENDGVVLGYDHPYLVAASSMPQGHSIEPEAMLAEAVTAALEMLETIVEGVSSAARVISDLGSLNAPRLCVYEVEVATGRGKLVSWDRRLGRSKGK